MSIKSIRTAEAEAKIAHKAAEEKAKKLAEVKPVDIIGTIDEVKKGTAHIVRDEDGTITGTNGGAYYQEALLMGNGTMTTIAAETKEQVEAIKARMAGGVFGDGLLHKTVIIAGMPCDCCGKDEKELEADIEAAEIYAAKHGANVIRDIDVAEQLVEAELDKEDLEQITVQGIDFILNYTGKYVMSLSGETVASLEDIKSKLSKEDVKTILTERVNSIVDCRGNELIECLLRGCGLDDYDEDDDCDEDEEE